VLSDAKKVFLLHGNSLSTLVLRLALALISGISGLARAQVKSVIHRIVLALRACACVPASTSIVLALAFLLLECLFLLGVPESLPVPRILPVALTVVVA